MCLCLKKTTSMSKSGGPISYLKCTALMSERSWKLFSILECILCAPRVYCTLSIQRKRVCLCSELSRNRDGKIERIRFGCSFGDLMHSHRIIRRFKCSFV